MSEEKQPIVIEDKDEDVTVIDEPGLAEKLIASNSVVPSSDKDGEFEITECFIVGDDNKVVSSDDVSKQIRKAVGFDAEGVKEETGDNTSRLDVKKFVEGSTQSQLELNTSGVPEAASNPENQFVEPPFPPELMAKFLEVDPVHFRSVKAKTIDSVGRRAAIIPAFTTDGMPIDPSKLTDEDKEKIIKETIQVRFFMENCNDIIAFEGVTEKACMDHEAIGWGAIEVIRSRDMKIRKLSHIPASRIRVLQSFRGFVEMVGNGKYIYYQLFGRKVVTPTRLSPIGDIAEPYNPRLDGPLTPGTGKDDQQWNLISKTTGKKEDDLTLEESANEILFIPKVHSNTVHYGISDVVPALGELLGNIEIRDYLLQFFDYNTIPQYAVLIEGGKLSTEVKETIQKYFSTEVKGKAHKTLIIPVPSMGGDVKIRFEKLAADTKEGSFQQTKKNNAQGIMTAHGVSPAIIGINDTASLGSGKGLSQAEIYKDRVITPLQLRWERALNKLFSLGLGVTMVQLKYNPLDIRDREGEATVLTLYQKNGDLTTNEVRERAQLGDPIEGGDRAYVVVGNEPVFIDELGNGETEGDNEQLRDELEQLRIELAARASDKDAQITELPTIEDVTQPGQPDNEALESPGFPSTTP